jgi:hypothetical protein
MALEPAARERLVAIMGRAAGGDPAAAVSLYSAFGRQIGGCVRHLARTRGGRHLSHDDLDGLTFDACLALASVAGAWRPDGALPWVWGRGRITALVDAAIGPPTSVFTGDEMLGPAPPPSEAPTDPCSPLVTLHDLAAADDRCELLVEVAGRLGRRDTDVLLQYALQQAAGDPSPSHTIAASTGLAPGAVRKVVSRSRRRLAAAIASDTRYAPLSGIALARSPSARAA